ncbi:hypothetical protein [Aurantimonas aggregata]|uniref:hypothetical protein n=1 Tax=Aurantimonas aggregata TaxID=2047720 RepID=UPI0019446B31|nr:hypothetical protein [Aurantimonas aggregata]
MTRLSLLLGGVALFALPISAASADCREEIAQLQDSDVTASISGAADSGPAEGTTTNFETGAGVDTSGGVSKDGSTAPLETDNSTTAGGSTAPTGGAGAAAATAGATTPAGGTGTAAGASQQADAGGQAGEIAKDGSNMPLEDAASEETAMSGQDAQSQQAGADTAASGQAGASTMANAAGNEDGGFQDAIDRAEAALAAGDEAACMTAVEEAKGLQTQ